MRESPRLAYRHGRDSRGDYLFKLCSRAKSYLHHRGFYLVDERWRPSSSSLEMLRSLLPVDGSENEEGDVDRGVDNSCVLPSPHFPPK
ncbi:uncharacterized [Tachysurus ichikawai]